MSLNFKNKASTRPGDVRPRDAFAIKVVAMVNDAGDWAAYQGPSDWTDEQVALSGDIIPQEAAEALFYVCRHLPFGEG